MIITISREFGSGGRELGKRLADILNFDYYDHEIISAVAENRDMDSDFVEDSLGQHGWRDYPLTLRSTLGSPFYVQSLSVNLLLEQKRVIEKIASLGKNCIIVGRDADVLLAEHHPFNLFVCASPDAKIKRCQERAPEGENLTEKELLRKMKQIDKTRSQTRMILSGSEWGQRGTYDLVVNTTTWDIKELAPAVADFAMRWFNRKQQ